MGRLSNESSSLLDGFIDNEHLGNDNVALFWWWGPCIDRCTHSILLLPCLSMEGRVKVDYLGPGNYHHPSKQ